MLHHDWLQSFGCGGGPFHGGVPFGGGGGGGGSLADPFGVGGPLTGGPSLLSAIVRVMPDFTKETLLC